MVTMQDCSYRDHDLLTLEHSRLPYYKSHAGSAVFFIGLYTSNANTKMTHLPQFPCISYIASLLLLILSFMFCSFKLYLTGRISLSLLSVHFRPLKLLYFTGFCCCWYKRKERREKKIRLSLLSWLATFGSL